MEDRANYYTRKADPLGHFANDADRQNEKLVALELENAWGCEVKPFGPLSPIDFYALRNGLMVGMLELKSRTHASTRFDTVFLNLRKWLAMRMGEIGFAVPSVFIVKFTDGIFYIPLADVPTGKIVIGGTKRIVKAYSDIEPVIEVPINLLKKVQDE